MQPLEGKKMACDPSITGQHWWRFTVEPVAHGTPNCISFVVILSGSGEAQSPFAALRDALSTDRTRSERCHVTRRCATMVSPAGADIWAEPGKGRYWPRAPFRSYSRKQSAADLLFTSNVGFGGVYGSHAPGHNRTCTFFLCQGAALPTREQLGDGQCIGPPSRLLALDIA